MRAGKPWGSLNEEVDCINVMGSPRHGCIERCQECKECPWYKDTIHCIHPEIYNYYSKQGTFTKGTPYPNTARKLPAQPTITLPRWLFGILLFGCCCWGFILGAVIL